MPATSSSPDTDHQLIVGGGDSDLDSRLSKELDAHNFAAVGEWVREDSRKEGWGGRMLEAAENLASDRGCRQLLVSSFTFQAPDFYRRHGYTEFARSEGLPIEGVADVHFAKVL